jgi:hypothetical protein
LITAKQPRESDVLEAEGRSIDRLALDRPVLQEGVDSSFLCVPAGECRTFRVSAWKTRS